MQLGLLAFIDAHGAPQQHRHSGAMGQWIRQCFPLAWVDQSNRHVSLGSPGGNPIGTFAVHMLNDQEFSRHSWPQSRK